MPLVRFLPDDVAAPLATGETILEAARAAGVPHISACDGEAKCSTCRVLVLEGLAQCSPRTEQEQALATRLGFQERVRLACQTSATGDITVRRLVLDPDDTRLLDQRRSSARRRVGRELDVAVLFTDVRDFTTLSVELLPYDAIHILERFITAATEAVDRFGGSVTSYMGDGFMALFGADRVSHPERDAVRAGWSIMEAVDALQPYIRQVHDRRLEVGVGIHAGPAIVGSVGPGGTLTALGDTVNTAARIEQATKTVGSSFVISDEVAARVGKLIDRTRLTPLALPGKDPVVLWSVDALNE